MELPSEWVSLPNTGASTKVYRVRVQGGGKLSKLLGIVDKNSRERIEIRAAEYEGHPYIDIRTYWRTRDDEEWRPSKKGVTLKPELVEELIVALKKVRDGRKA